MNNTPLVNISLLLKENNISTENAVRSLLIKNSFRALSIVVKPFITGNIQEIPISGKTPFSVIVTS